jgi:hypothetical protein
MRVTKKPEVEETAEGVNDHSTFYEERNETMEGIDPGLVALMKDSNGDDKTLWLFLLLLLYGKDGFGGGAGGQCCPPVTLEQLNDTQNAIQNQTSQRFDAQTGHLNQMQNAITERTLDITRDQAANAFRNETGQALIGRAIADAATANQLGQKDLTAAIAACCCDNLLAQKDTQRAIADCCCQTKNSIAMQTQVLSQQICNDGDKTRALITQNKIDELQAQLTDQKLANSNLAQTTQLQASIREACCQPCQPCHPHPWWHGNGGNGGPPGPGVG